MRKWGLQILSVTQCEVKAPYDTYLNGLDKQEIANLKDLQTKLGKYCGLMVGSIESPNNGAGNWE